MPAFSSLVVASAPGPRTGLANGILNSARQAVGALAGAVLGSLLAQNKPRPRDYSFAPPLALAAGVLLVAAVVAWFGTRHESGDRPAAGHRVPAGADQSR